MFNVKLASNCLNGIKAGFDGIEEPGFNILAQPWISSLYAHT